MSWMGYQPPAMQQQQALQQRFFQVDTDRSGQISAEELARAFSSGGQPFPEKTAKFLIAMFDRNRTGQIGFQEFMALDSFVNRARTSFMACDTARSGFLNTQQVPAAMSQVGLPLDPQMCMSTMRSFDPYGRGQLDYTGFMTMVAYTGWMKSIWDWYDPQRTGQMHLNWGQWLTLGLWLK